MLQELKVAQDSSVPRGQCIVMTNRKTVYVGPIGLRLVPFITPDSLLILNPADFADGEDFIKRQVN